MLTVTFNRLAAVLILKCISVGSFHLRLDKEPVHYLRCQTHTDLRLWYNTDKTKVAYIADSDGTIDTPEKRILSQPLNSEERELQEYFTKKEFRYMDVFLDDRNIIDSEQSRPGSQTKWKRIFRQVATWMMEHKFLETDVRIFGKFAEVQRDRFFQRVNYRQFPVPVLKNMHPIAQEECEKGLLYCLKVVHENAYAQVYQFNKYLNSDHSFFLKQYQHLLRGHKHSDKLSSTALIFAKNDFCAVQGDLGWTWFPGQNFAPFLNHNDLFEFRTTASYYLCNYTLTQKRLYERFAYPGTAEVYYAKPGTGRYKALECVFPGSHSISNLPTEVFRRISFDYTMATMDGFECNKVGTCKLPIGGRVGEKWRDDHIFWDFSCALMAFCPDQCCGAFKNPLDDSSDINSCKPPHHDFPCRDGGHNDKCDYDVKKNTNFYDLIQNRMNITCGCNEKEGKRWDSFLALCLDVDECEESNPCPADTEVCVNRLNGSKPLCICEFGYYRNNQTHQCVVDPNSGLFQSFDEIEKSMKAIYEPIQEGKNPKTGKTGESEAVRQALGNVGGIFARTSSSSSVYSFYIMVLPSSAVILFFWFF